MIYPILYLITTIAAIANAVYVYDFEFSFMGIGGWVVAAMLFLEKFSIALDKYIENFLQNKNTRGE